MAKAVPLFLSYFKTLSIGTASRNQTRALCSAVKHSTDWANPGRSTSLKKWLRNKFLLISMMDTNKFESFIGLLVKTWKM